QFIEGPVALVSEGNAIHVAEEHCSGKLQLLDRTTKLTDRCRWIVQWKSRECAEAGASLSDDLRERVIHEGRVFSSTRRRFDVCSRRCQRDDLGIDALLLEH